MERLGEQCHWLKSDVEGKICKSAEKSLRKSEDFLQNMWWIAHAGVCVSMGLGNS